MGMIHVYVLFQRMIFSPTFAMMIPTNFVALPGDKTTGVLLACERRVFFGSVSQSLGYPFWEATQQKIAVFQTPSGYSF